jgi:hypothetical protein
VNTVDPRKIKGQITLCRWHYEQGDYETAISECQKGLQLDPSDTELKELLRKVKHAKVTERNQGGPNQ